MSREATVLLVDDDEIDCETVQRSFRKHQLSNPITIAQDGVEALQILRTTENGVRRPYLILLDLNMPLINGFDFIAALRQLSFPNKENVKIIVLTSSSQSQDIEQAHSLGVDHYLTKPLTVNELQNTIFTLRKKALRAENG